MDYNEFLRSKVIVAKQSGFAVTLDEINPVCKPHQKDAVQWACKGGCRALFESFGVGKSVQELEWCRLVVAHEGGAALIVLPLGVKPEFAHDAQQLLGWKNPPPYVRTMSECMEKLDDIRNGEEWACEYPVLLTNYERVRDGDIDPSYFTATSLDEASVLRSFGSKTYQTFLEKFKDVRFKLVATATPSPNRYKELIHYASYLGILDSGAALTRFFQRDSTKANHLTLYPHREEEFWLWVSTWAMFLQKPSDLGYDDTGYDLPPIEVHYHKLHATEDELPVDRDNQTMLFRDAALGLQEAAKEKRLSIGQRVDEIVKIAQGYGVGEPRNDGSGLPKQIVIWCTLNNEQLAIERALRQAGISYTSLTGSQEIEYREEKLTEWKMGKTAAFITKPEMYGSGVNLQQCSRMIFAGISYQFEDFIQSIHREARYGQNETVHVDIIYMDTEAEILKALLEKWQNHDKMQEKMTSILREYGLNAREAEKRMERSIGVDRMEVKGKHYKAVLNDCIQETAKMPDNSVDMICTSIPFGNHYEYANSYNDLGFNEDTTRFFEQMDYLAPSLLRVLKPGRIYACHTKDRVLFGNATGTGMPTIEPFHALTIQHYMKHGFQYIGMITVVTDVVRENNQTYRLGWTEQCKDGSKMGVGCPEYILLFRKLPTSHEKAYADVPVEKTKEEYTRAQWQIDAHAYWRSSGDRLIGKDELEHVPVKELQKVYRRFSRDNVYDYNEHVALAKNLDDNRKLPATFMVVAPGSWTDEVWDDINRMRTLNGSQSLKGKQLHVCPLQFDIVERLIHRYTNEGDTVYDPFGGLMTVPMEAVKMGRYGIGCELNPDYFRDGVGYLDEADNGRDMPTLFDFLPDEEKGEDADDSNESCENQMSIEEVINFRD